MPKAPASRGSVFSRVPLAAWVLAGSFLAAIALAATHSPSSIISFDEGFHGGAALFVLETLRWLLHLPGSSRPVYLITEFPNGLTLYPPLWIGLAGFLGLIFGASTQVFRFATSIFYALSVFGTFWFLARAYRGEPNRGKLAGVVSAAVVASVPLVMIYSNLMMLEVPLMLGIGACVGAFYLYVMGLIPRRPWTILFVCLIFLLGPLTKIAGLEIIWGVAVMFAVGSSVLFWRQRFYRHFLKPELLLFAAVSVLGIAADIWLVKRYLHVDMVGFFLGQSQNQGSHGILQTAWENRYYYLRDFRNMPVLSLVWFGSVAAYGLWKRTPLALFLAVWAVGVYAAFSGVLPQTPQYIMPIFLPLGMATGLLLTDLSGLIRRVRFSVGALAAATVGLVIWQILSMPLSDTYAWRARQTGVADAAAIIAREAGPSDRVITWLDGTTYAVRQAGIAAGKQIEVENADTQLCPQAMDDSFEWALVVNEPPLISALDRQALAGSGWKLVGRFGDDQTTLLYHNDAQIWPLVIRGADHDLSQAVADLTSTSGSVLKITHDESQPAFWGCYRVMPLGTHTVTYRLRAENVDPGVADSQGVLRLEYSGVPNGDVSDLNITAGQLRQPGYHDYSFTITQSRLNRPGEFKLTSLEGATVYLDTVTVR